MGYDQLTIGRLAKRAGVNIETIRFYERKGILQKPSKLKGAFRIYSEQDAVRIQFIKRAQNLGFTLSEIVEMFRLEKNSRVSCLRLKEKVDAKITHLNQKIADLERMRDSLSRLATACNEGKESVRECKISECFEQKC